MSIKINTLLLDLLDLRLQNLRDDNPVSIQHKEWISDSIKATEQARLYVVDIFAEVKTLREQLAIAVEALEQIDYRTTEHCEAQDVASEALAAIRAAGGDE